MFFAGSKKLKVGIVLLSFIGLVFSLSCAFSHPEASAHSPSAEAGTFLIQGSETCCDTNLSEHHKPLNGEFLAVPKETNRNPLNLLFLGLIAVSMIFGRHFLDHVGRRLSVLQKLYIRDNPHIPLFNHLVLAFSRGILNPKK